MGDASKKLIYIANDHVGDSLKKYIVYCLSDGGYNVEDLGTDGDSSVDYPTYAHRLCKKMINNPKSIGILLCGTGQGMAMTANRYDDIRASVCWSKDIASYARKHNDSNVLCIPCRFIKTKISYAIVSTFLDTEFESGRHKRRIDLIDNE